MAAADDCVFCRIVAGEIPAEKVRETDRTLAFRDVNPQAPVHVLVIPKDHLADLDAVAAVDPALLGLLLSESAAVAADQSVTETGYRVVVNTGTQGGQAVAHCHVHVVGGRQLSDRLG